MADRIDCGHFESVDELRGVETCELVEGGGGSDLGQELSVRPIISPHSIASHRDTAIEEVGRIPLNGDRCACSRLQERFVHLLWVTGRSQHNSCLLKALTFRVDGGH